MIHRVLAVAVAVLPVLFFPDASVAARPHRAPASPVRLTLEPGVSLAFSDGWTACRRDLNQQLHAPAIPEKIAAEVCRPVKNGETAIHLNNLLLHAPVSLLVDQRAMSTMSEDALAAATPEMQAYLYAFACKNMGEILEVAQDSVRDCSVSTTNVSQHLAIRASVTLVRGSRMNRLDLYWIPTDQGEVWLQFESPRETQAASRAEIDAVVASAEIEPGSLATQTVALRPAPGVSLSLPSGWMACDDATNALLGNRPDPLGVRQKSCADVAADTKLAAFNPQPLENVTVLVKYKSEKDLTESQIARLSGDRLKEVTPQVCDSVTKPLKDDNEAVDSCVVTVETVGGHQALVATVVGAMWKERPTDRLRARIYFVPYDQGFATIAFYVPVVIAPLCDPLVDAAVQSLVFQ